MAGAQERGDDRVHPKVIQGRDKSAASTEWRYSISSKDLDVNEFSHQIQAHWRIENSFHWVLDVVFDEDASRVRCHHGAENIALLRRICPNLIKQDPTKGSIKVKRKRAAGSSEYLEHLLSLQPLDNSQATASA